MTEPFAHLTHGARRALALPVDERIAFLKKDRWIGYERAAAVLQKMERIVQQERAARPPCMIVVGAPNNGKTHLLRKFHRAHPPYEAPEGEGAKIPVLLIEDLKGPDERALYNSIIETLGFPNKPNDPVAKLEYKAHRILIHYDVRVLLIDEFNTLANGSATKQRHMLNVLKTLSTRRQISIIGAGTRAASQLMQLDTQFSTRFVPEALPLWQMGRSWQTLLATFERLIPLPEPSGLAATNFARKLHAESEGNIGHAWDLVELLATHAIETGADRLTSAMIGEIGWVQPSERVAQAQKQAAEAWP